MRPARSRWSGASSRTDNAPVRGPSVFGGCFVRLIRARLGGAELRKAIVIGALVGLDVPLAWIAGVIVVVIAVADAPGDGGDRGHLTELGVFG